MLKIILNLEKGLVFLLLQRDKNIKPIHVVWGIPKGHTKPAVLVTAYRPDNELWEDDYVRRKKRKKGIIRKCSMKANMWPKWILS